jgi:hypothetical protein
MISTLALVAQLVIAFSIAIVWVFRFDNIVIEFKQYGLSTLTRSLVGASKIVLATLLVVGVWVPSLVLISALLMGLLMISAQYFHFKVNNPFQKRIPSLFLLILCLFVAAVSLNWIA